MTDRHEDCPWTPDRWSELATTLEHLRASVDRLTETHDALQRRVSGLIDSRATTAVFSAAVGGGVSAAIFWIKNLWRP